MDLEYCDLDTCEQVTGTVVVIDVCRAFTTAACAFSVGAERVLLAGTVGETMELRTRFPDSLVTGEIEGLPVPHFDLWNSPSQMLRADLKGRTLIQRTSAGTQGVVRARNAEYLLAASFTVAGATARAIQRLNPEKVTFVMTGVSDDDPRYGLEDRACAIYLSALLRGEQPDPYDFLRWPEDFIAVHNLDDMAEPLRTQFYADMSICQQVDRFDFAMQIQRKDTLLIMEAV